MKRTYQPKKLHRKKEHGFMKRMATRAMKVRPVKSAYVMDFTLMT